MRINKIILALASMAFGAMAALLLQHLLVYRIDKIKESTTSDNNYNIALSALKRDYPDYINLFSGKIFSMKIVGAKISCYFFYKKSYIIYEDNDFIYCFDKASGNFIGRL